MFDRLFNVGGSVPTYSALRRGSNEFVGGCTRVSSFFGSSVTVLMTSSVI